MREYWSIRLLAFALLSVLFTVPAKSQSVVIKGRVTIADGAGVQDAVVEAIPTEKSRGNRRTKTDARGRFSIPFTEYGKYTFGVAKEEMLIESVAITIRTASNMVEFEKKGNVGPDQKIPEFDLQPGRVVEVNFVLIPKSQVAQREKEAAQATAGQGIGEASQLNREGKFAESEAALENVDATGTQGAQIQYLHGLNLVGLGRKVDAESAFARAIEIDPAIAGPNAQLGALLYSKGEKERALAHFDAEIRLSPTAKPVAINRALVLADLGRKELAVEAWKKVLEIDPTEASAYQELASLYGELGRPADAADALKQLDRFGKKDAARWFNIGVGYANSDNLAEAEEAYRKALEVDPKFPEANRELGYLMLRKGDQAAAVAFFEAYLAARPDAPDAKEVRGVVDSAKGPKGRR